jgi:hypothetical protein
MIKKFRTATQVDTACSMGHHTLLTFALLITALWNLYQDAVYSCHSLKYDVWKVKLLQTKIPSSWEGKQKTFLCILVYIVLWGRKNKQWRRSEIMSRSVVHILDTFGNNVVSTVKTEYALKKKGLWYTYLRCSEINVFCCSATVGGAHVWTARLLNFM